MLALFVYPWYTLGMYTFTTPDAIYDLSFAQPDNIKFTSDTEHELQIILDTLELFGQADDLDNPPLTSAKIVQEDDTEYSLTLSRADAALYLQAEILNFLGPEGNL